MGDYDLNAELYAERLAFRARIAALEAKVEAATDLLARSKVDGGMEWDRTAPGNRERHLEVARLEIEAALSRDKKDGA